MILFYERVCVEMMPLSDVYGENVQRFCKKVTYLTSDHIRAGQPGRELRQQGERSQAGGGVPHLRQTGRQSQATGVSHHQRQPRHQGGPGGGGGGGQS